MNEWNLSEFQTYCDSVNNLLKNQNLPEVLSFNSEVKKEYLDNLKGKMTATVIASSELDKNQINKIKKLLADNYSQEIDIDLEIDEKILGGLIVKIGSKMIDSSLLTRLKLMQSNMSEV